MQLKNESACITCNDPLNASVGIDTGSGFVACTESCRGIADEVWAILDANTKCATDGSEARIIMGSYDPADYFESVMMYARHFVDNRASAFTLAELVVELPPRIEEASDKQLTGWYGFFDMELSDVIRSYPSYEGEVSQVIMKLASTVLSRVYEEAEKMAKDAVSRAIQAAPFVSSDTDALVVQFSKSLAVRLDAVVKAEIIGDIAFRDTDQRLWFTLASRLYREVDEATQSYLGDIDDYSDLKRIGQGLSFASQLAEEIHLQPPPGKQAF